MDLLAELHRHFRYETFRLGQEEAVQRILAGESLLVVMPTGSGKSLCFQLPAFMGEGLTLVVSPLIALMKDQVDALAERDLAAATCINSTIDPEEQRARIDGMATGQYRLVYVAPERFRNARFVNSLSRIPLDRLVVDEAHCISEWGHDFRPDYLYLRDVIASLDGPQVIALTATATPRVQDDIVAALGATDMGKVVTGFDRPNLRFEVLKSHYADDKIAAMERLAAQLQGSGIVYTGTRRDAETVADLLQQQLGEAVGCYHAGLPDDVRRLTQDTFMSGRTRIVVATKAFGMGIDKHDLRFVVHYSIPGSVEAYYQEAGRAGRDGQPARCILLYTPADRGLQEFFIEKDVPSQGDVYSLFDSIAARCSAGDQCAVDSDEAKAQLGLHPNATAIALALLEKAGAIQRLDRTASGMRVALKEGRVQDERLAHAFHDAYQRQDEKRAMLAAMVEYAETASCRRQYILDYFGDSTRLASAAACCDNCNDVAAPVDFAAGATPNSTHVAHTILACVTSLPFGVGRQKLSGVLRGSKAKWVKQFNYQRSPQYGALGAYTGTVIDSLINHLLDVGLLTVEHGEFPVIAITPQGLEMLELGEAVALPGLGEPHAAAPKQARATFHDVDLSAADPTLFEALREFRTREARGRQWAPFRVFTDDTLKAIAALRPATDAQLLDIPGVGPKKLDDFGNEVLAIVKAHHDSAPRAPAQHAPAATPQDAAEPGHGGANTLAGPWDAGWAAGPTTAVHEGQRARTPIGSLIYDLKYRAQADRARDAAQQLAGIHEAAGALTRAHLCVPVPSAKAEGGFDAPAQVAIALSRLTGIPVSLGIISRSRPAQPQAQLPTDEDKEANVRGAFQVGNAARIKGTRVVLIDDFVDSGATLAECTRVLQAAGAASVCVLAVGRTVR